MLKYIFRRVLWFFPVIIAVSFITFSLMHLTPGGPWDASPKPLAPATRVAMAKAFGLDKPFLEQYFIYMTNALHGDLGVPYHGTRNVTQLIQDGLPVTGGLGLFALIFSILIGVPLGVLAALRHNGFIDNLTRFVVTVGTSIPRFVIGIFIILVFGVFLGLIRIQFSRTDWTTWIAPALLLALGPISAIMRLTRSSVLEVLSEDYIRTARAKGLRPSVVNYRHVLRNALIPVVTLLGPLAADLVTGSFIVEYLFTIPGIGRLTVQSVGARDWPVFLGLTLFYALIVIIFNLVVDLTYSFLDPRIAYG